MFAAIVLVAGASQRFGSPKALASCRGQIVIDRILHTLLDANLDEIVIVLGADHEVIRPHIFKHKKVKVVYNKNYNYGQTSSFQCGLKSVSEEIKAVFLIPVDVPLIDPSTIRKLLEKFQDRCTSILIPTFKGTRGHPPVFNMALKEEILQLDAKEGINTIAHCHSKEIMLYEINDAGICLSFNTPDELDKINSADP